MGLRPTYEHENISVSNLSPRTHHPFLFVILSVAERSAVRLSQSRKPRVASLLITGLPLSPSSVIPIFDGARPTGPGLP
jgi:hypothetical protein